MPQNIETFKAAFQFKEGPLCLQDCECNAKVSLIHELWRAYTVSYCRVPCEPGTASRSVQKDPVGRIELQSTGKKKCYFPTRKARRGHVQGRSVCHFE